MKLSIACDHGGYELKIKIMEMLKEITFIDCGTDNLESCDYPDFAFKAAELVRDKKVDFGVVICKSGIGMSIAANKVKNIRCALVKDVNTAILTKQHNNANMLALGANDVDAPLAVEIIKNWLDTQFMGAQHTRRIEKISKYED